ncbi:hypothetical protein PGIGA_G00138050, partial [Pangasianodon gigas]|nr:hypothetical protein [Pangasianodon gigas]
CVCVCVCVRERERERQFALRFRLKSDSSLNRYIDIKSLYCDNRQTFYCGS